MGSFTVNWRMIDPSDAEVSMSLEGDDATAIEILASRKSIIEKALERGWALRSLGPPQAAGRAPVNGNSNAQSKTAPSCEHGERKWKTGTSRKNNKPYRGWFCPANQCDPQF